MAKVRNGGAAERSQEWLRYGERTSLTRQYS